MRARTRGSSKSASMTRPPICAATICAAARGGSDGAAGKGVSCVGIRDSPSQPPQAVRPAARHFSWPLLLDLDFDIRNHRQTDQALPSLNDSRAPTGLTRKGKRGKKAGPEITMPGSSGDQTNPGAHHNGPRESGVSKRRLVRRFADVVASQKYRENFVNAQIEAQSGHDLAWIDRDVRRVGGWALRVWSGPQREETTVEPPPNRSQIEIEGGTAVCACGADRAGVLRPAQQWLARLELLARALVRHDLCVDERVSTHRREPGERTLQRELQFDATRLRSVESTDPSRCTGAPSMEAFIPSGFYSSVRSRQYAQRLRIRHGRSNPPLASV